MKRLLTWFLAAFLLGTLTLGCGGGAAQKGVNSGKDMPKPPDQTAS
ncbi:MAG: hypothetical protein JO112_07370 [Planctomycetes bacterium]|nr:hypothetical protein [Planctomycetota bacterium]